MFILSSSEGTMQVKLAPNADVESDKVNNSNNTGWVQNQTIAKELQRTEYLFTEH